ncbi:MAG: ATP-dependent DNA helicase [Lachnospiraceae bacterium]|nr:ATP-dependent DNA helicase [Lachnospiraceae bacterium]
MSKKRKDRENTLPVLKISVRNLVEFILRSGDIDNRYSDGARLDAMQEGSRIHRKIQKSMGPDYMAEVSLKIEIEMGEYILVVEGRADGIITPYDGKVTIDEIKGMYDRVDLFEEPVPVHLAQAKCYAYIYALMNGLDEIDVQMTYVNMDTEEVKRLTQSFEFKDLETWFDGLIKSYKKWSDFSFYWQKEMRKTIKPLEFPYEYRPGQKELASDVYRTILRKKDLFLQAPTGVGKTLSTIFPAVKAVGEGLADKIFYLTAKTMTASVASKTFDIFMERGYRAKTIQITAKEKMCLCEEMTCDPEHCEYAKGHFDRVNDAVYEMLNEKDKFMRDEIREFAKAQKVCPFEFSLDLSSWCDNIICDYNYVFDPTVYLKRFFAEGNKGEYLFLVDETHNLVDRGRQMYSASLKKEDFLAVRKLVKGHNKKLEDALSRCNKILLDMKRDCPDIKELDDVDIFVYSLMRLANVMDNFLKKSVGFVHRKEVTEFYFELRNFLNIYELVDRHYVIYCEFDENDDFVVKLFCVDPSFNLEQCLKKARTTVFFSATLLPIGYYKSLLTKKTDSYAIYAESSFAKEQKLLLVAGDVTTKYTRRSEDEYKKMASYIYEMVKAKDGKYMVFAPSYLMMKNVKEAFETILEAQDDERVVNGSWRLLMQESRMKEADREAFLEEFNGDGTLVAFCVMGGIFAEGIDLTEEKLIGAVILGTGLPQVGHEQEVLKSYFDDMDGEGFDYAYRIPGMNKVLQSAGRVIRTVKDRGVIMLLDERFLQSAYKNLFPREWDDYRICNLNTAGEEIRKFWSDNA